MWMQGSKREKQPWLFWQEKKQVESKDYGLKKAKVTSALAAEACTIDNACLIAQNQPYLKILIESDCKIIINVTFGYSTCPSSVNAIVEDIKLFLDDNSNISLYWVSRLANMAMHDGFSI